MMDSGQTRSAGFSLIEVTLALFVVGLGLLTLFSLFPAGLNQATMAQDDTQMALFAESLLSEMRGRIADMTDEEWNTASFGIPINSIETRTNWPVPGRHVRFLVQISEIGDDVWGINLWVQAGEFGTRNFETFKDGAVSFYTEMVRLVAPVE